MNLRMRWRPRCLRFQMEMIFIQLRLNQLDQPAHQDAIVCAIEDAAVSDDLPWFTFIKNDKLHRSLIRHLLKIRRPLIKKKWKQLVSSDYKQQGVRLSLNLISMRGLWGKGGRLILYGWLARDSRRRECCMWGLTCEWC